MAAIDGTGRWRGREVEGTLASGYALTLTARRRLRWECWAALFREEAGHRGRRRKRERSNRGSTVRTGGHRQGRTKGQLMLLLLLLLVLLMLLEQRRSRLLKLSLLQGSRSGHRNIGRLLMTLTVVGISGSSSGSRSSLGSMIGGHRTVMVPGLFRIVHKVASRSVRTEPDTVERAAQLGLVLWMTLKVAQFLHAVRKLALVTILTLTRFFERSAQLGFISRGIDLLRQRFRLRAFQLPVTSATATTSTTTGHPSTSGGRVH